MLLQNHASPLTETKAENHLFSFGPFTVDGGQGVLSRNGAEIPLRPKTFDVLIFLLQHPKRLVSREELMGSVWPDVIVTDDSLTQCLTEIRKALGDNERAIVRTVPRRGYLFDLPVKVSRMTRPGLETNSRARWRVPSLWTIIALTILALAISANRWYRPAPLKGTQIAGTTVEEASIAVLPFVDLSENSDQEFLAYGISEEILNTLTQVRGLTVIARTSSFALANQNMDIQEIANRLGVTHVLEGSLRKAGDQVRITAQLIDGASGIHLWSHSYDDQINEVFALQSSIAQAITEVLASRMLSPIDPYDKRMDSSLDTKNLEAWNLYLRGQYFYGRRADGDIVRAQREYEQALQLDPEFAAAWMGLANALYIRFAQDDLSENEKLKKSEAMPLMLQAIEKSLELNPRNAEARARMAQYQWRAGNFEASLEQTYLAMQFGGNNALVQAVLAGISLWFAGPDTAVELQRRAVRLDPVGLLQIENLAHYLYWAGRFDEAEAVLHQASELRQDQRIESVDLAEWISLLQGKLEKAMTLLEELPQGSIRDQAESMVSTLQGNHPESDEALSRLMQKEDFDSQAAVAYVFGFRGDIDAAFLALNHVTGNLLSEPDLSESRERLFDLKLSPFLQALHSDPRWREWLVRTEEWQRTPIDAEMTDALQSYAATGTVGARLTR